MISIGDVDGDTAHVRILRIDVSKEKVQSVQGVREEVSGLEQALTALIRNFEAKTGCPVVAAEHSRTSGKVYWTVKVSIGRG